MTDLPGQADSGRGGGALKDAGRLVYTATPMSKSEAKMYGISEAERRRLLRYDPAKVNLAPPSAEAMWFKLIGVPLGNCTTDYPGGDEVQTVERWYPPSVWAVLTEDVIDRILDQIDRGPEPEGARYSAAPQAGEKRAAWRVVKRECPKLSDDQAKKVINQWLESGVLEERPYIPQTPATVCGGSSPAVPL